MNSITRRSALGAAIAVPAAAALARAAQAAAPTEIELFFPVPVQGMLANKMKELIDRFNSGHEGVKVTAVYTGSYDDTNFENPRRDQGREAAGGGHHVRQFRARIRDQ